jgi:hypothetical protein
MAAKDIRLGTDARERMTETLKKQLVSRWMFMTV